MYYTPYEDQHIYPSWESQPKARKEHTCCECQETIPIGAYYKCIAGVLGRWWEKDKQFVSHKVCLKCVKDWEEIIGVFLENHYGTAFIVYGLLREAIKESLMQGWLDFHSPLLQRWKRIDSGLFREWIDTPEEEGGATERELAFAQMQRYSQPFF